MKRTRVIGGAGLAALVATGVVTAGVVTAGVVAAVPAAASSALEWGPCPDDLVSLECATVTVPVDYRAPDGAAMDLLISRLPSANPQARRGVLLTNPGGPGGSGLSFPADLAALGLPASVAEAYDVIGMDTRGVGHSTPVSCGFATGQAYFGNVPPYAVDDDAVLAQADVARGVAEQCGANGGAALPHLSTANMARDLDRIRQALGEERASFLGYSYGSALGAAYASMFPETVDRVVLDSNVGDTRLDHDGMRLFGRGVEDAFPDFAAWAAARHGAYGLGRTPAQVRRTYFALAERLDENPIAGLDGVLFRLGTFGSLYRDSRYPLMAATWQAVLRSDESAVTDTMGEFAGAAEPSEYDNAWTVFLAVTCNDSDWSEDVGTYRDAVAEDRERFPMFGAAAANVTPCAFWPTEPVEPPVEVVDDGSRDVLVVQNERDPATPLAGGQKLRKAFGDRARLVTVDGSGHGAYLIGDNACALTTTTAFLVDGDFPRRDVTCRAGKASGLAGQERNAALERLG